MAISVSHGPISLALQLAQEAGEGEGRYKRLQMAQQILDRINAEAGQSLQFRNLQEQQKRSDIATALEYERMALDERRAQQQLAERESISRADQLYRDRAFALQERQQARLEGKEGQAEAARESFTERFGMPPEQLEASMQQQRMQMEQQKQIALQKAFSGTPAARNMQERIKVLESQLKQAESNIKRFSDPISADIGEIRPRKGSEKEFTEAYADLGRYNEALSKERQRYSQMLSEVDAGILPQQGAKQPVISETDIDNKASLLASMIPSMLPSTMLSNPQAIRNAVIQYLVRTSGVSPKDPDVQQFADLVVSKVIGQ